ncbi:hypothetical protein B484DRAFT_458460 [Ochromonadaceae sp. CCMP2298]|nr:hypothetical protein B484DRAFT_458460 [Ochromonadaceae sp. CCMP2298]
MATAQEDHPDDNWTHQVQRVNDLQFILTAEKRATEAAQRQYSAAIEAAQRKFAAIEASQRKYSAASIALKAAVSEMQDAEKKYAADHAADYSQQIVDRGKYDAELSAISLAVLMNSTGKQLLDTNAIFDAQRLCQSNHVDGTRGALKSTFYWRLSDDNATVRVAQEMTSRKLEVDKRRQAFGSFQAPGAKRQRTD